MFLVSVPPEPTGIEWVAPEDCPDARQFEAHIQALMVRSEVTQIDAKGRIQPTPDGYSVHLEVQSESRALEADDCAQLTVAAALVVAVAYDPVGVSKTVVENTATATEPTKRVPPPDRSQPPLVPHPASRPTRPTRSRQRPEPVGVDGPPEHRERPRPAQLQGLLRPKIRLGGGVLPGLNRGVGLTGGIRGKSWRAELQLGYWFAQTVSIEGGGAKLRLADAGFRGCWEPAFAAVSVPLCAGAEMGALIGQGSGDTFDVRTRVEAWVAAAGSVGVRWSLTPRVALSAQLEPLVNLRRPGFHLGQDRLFRVDAVGGRGALGIELRFP